MASYDELHISVEKLGEDVEALRAAHTSYKKFLAEFKTNVAGIEASWDSGESQVVAAFKAKFLAAEKKLDQLEKDLNTLHTTMDSKCQEFSAAEKASLNLFQ